MKPIKLMIAATVIGLCVIALAPAADILLVWAIAVLARYSTALLWIAVAVVAIVVTRKCSSRATHRQVRRELNSE